MEKNLICVAVAAFALVLATFAYLHVPAVAAQPGDAADPLVTRRFVEENIAQLADEVALLRGIVTQVAPGALPNVPQFTPVSNTSNLPQAERDVIIAEILHHFDKVYGERLDAALSNVPAPGYEPREPQMVIFQVLNPQAGQIITFKAGAEFILRGGSATAVTGVYNGIPDVTAGSDVMNGETLGLNHLMMIPFTDGRGVHFHSESWIMVRGGYIVH